MTVLFDILKKEPSGAFVWLEAVNDIQTARGRLEQLSAESSWEFVVFRQIDLRIVATSRPRTPKVGVPHDTHTSKIGRDATIKILIADDHVIFRDGLRKLLDSDGEITVVGEAANGAECIKMLGSLKPGAP